MEAQTWQGTLELWADSRHQVTHDMPDQCFLGVMLAELSVAAFKLASCNQILLRDWRQEMWIHRANKLAAYLRLDTAVMNFTMERS